MIRCFCDPGAKLHLQSPIHLFPLNICQLTCNSFEARLSDGGGTWIPESAGFSNPWDNKTQFFLVSALFLVLCWCCNTRYKLAILSTANEQGFFLKVFFFLWNVFGNSIYSWISILHFQLRTFCCILRPFCLVLFHS